MTIQTYEVDYTGAQINTALRKSLSRYVGSLHFSDNTLATGIALTQTYYPIAIASTIDNNGNWTGINSRLVFTADDSGLFLIKAHVTITAPAANESLRARIGINGTTLEKTSSRSTVSGNPESGRDVSFDMHTIANLSENDFVEVFVGNWTNADDLTIRNLQITAIEL